MEHQEKLNKAIADVLRADTGAGSLVELTGHTPTNIRIARDTPPVKGMKPFLGFRIGPSVPLNNETTFLQESRVEFCCCSTQELTAMRIADRLEELVHNTTPASYWNFSNGDISNRSTRFANRGKSMHDEDTDVWTVQVDLDLIWYGQPCPVP